MEEETTKELQLGQSISSINPLRRFERYWKNYTHHVTHRGGRWSKVAGIRLEEVALVFRLEEVTLVRPVANGRGRMMMLSMMFVRNLDVISMLLNFISPLDMSKGVEIIGQFLTQHDIY